MTNDLDHLPPRDHNEPPQAELLLEQHADLIRRRDELLDSASRAPETVDGEDTAGKFAEAIRMIVALMAQAETKRVDAKEPYLKGGRLTDGFFQAIQNPLDAADEMLRDRLNLWMTATGTQQVRGDYGALASLQSRWTFELLSGGADLDIHALRRFIPLNVLAKAIRAFIDEGGRELRGVRIFETTKTVIR